MTRCQLMMAAAVVGFSLVGNASAQQTGGGGGATGGGGGGATGGGGGGTTGGGGGGTGGGTGSTSFNPTGGFSLGNAATRNATTTNSAISTSNILGPTYANPLFQGRAGSTTTTAPGGFGTPLYTTSNAPTGRTGAGGATGAGGGTAGIGVSPAGGVGGGTGGGIGGGQGTQTQQRSSGNSVSQGIAIAATPRFPITPVSSEAIEARVRAVLNRSTSIPNASQLGLEMDGRTLVLTGQVNSEDERRLVENVIRLTPGVRQLRNDITLP